MYVSIHFIYFPFVQTPNFFMACRTEAGKDNISYSPVASKLLNNPCVYNHCILSYKETVLILVEKKCRFFFKYLKIERLKKKKKKIEDITSLLLTAFHCSRYLIPK